jgi:hypothetical protein
MSSDTEQTTFSERVSEPQSGFSLDLLNLIEEKESFTTGDYTAIARRAQHHDVGYVDQTINLAERVLKRARKREGHHESVREAMTEWATSQSDGRFVDDEHSAVYDLSAHERNFGELDGDDSEKKDKAEIIIQWAEHEYGEDFLDSLKAEQAEELREEWEGVIEEETEAQMRKNFAEDLPDEYDGWLRLSPNCEHVDIAYETTIHGSHEIIAVYEDSDGSTCVEEFAAGDWLEANGNPRDARLNRPVLWEELPARARVYKHFGMFDGSPPENPLRSR